MGGPHKKNRTEKAQVRGLARGAFSIPHIFCQVCFTQDKVILYHGESSLTNFSVSRYFGATSFQNIMSGRFFFCNPKTQKGLFHRFLKQVANLSCCFLYLLFFLFPQVIFFFSVAQKKREKRGKREYCCHNNHHNNATAIYPIYDVHMILKRLKHNTENEGDKKCLGPIPVTD